MKKASSNTTKIIIAAVATLLLIIFTQVMSSGLLFIVGVFALYRLIKLASHGWYCTTCQMKFGFALLCFALVYINPFAVLFSIIILIWSDVLIQDSYESMYYG